MPYYYDSQGNYITSYSTAGGSCLIINFAPPMRVLLFILHS